MKAGDSLIIFPRQWCAKHGRSKQHALPVRKIFPQTFRICKIQNLRSDGKQLTETQNKRIQRISKVAHSSGQWTEIGVGKFDSLHSERFCSSEKSRRQIAILSLSTGVYIYIKLKFGHSSGIISN